MDAKETRAASLGFACKGTPEKLASMRFPIKPTPKKGTLAKNQKEEEQKRGGGKTTPPHVRIHVPSPFAGQGAPMLGSIHFEPQGFEPGPKFLPRPIPWADSENPNERSRDQLNGTHSKGPS